MSAAIQVQDKLFVPLITAEQIRVRIVEMARQINADYSGRNPLFIVVLNGSFMFAADLFRHIETQAAISFVKLSSYSGTASTGQVLTAMGLQEDITGRDVVIVEDIIDTGKTLASFLPTVQAAGAASVRIASFLVKPTALKYDVHADYTAFEIEDKFVVGYGLDYNGYGRNIPGLYVLK